MSDTKHYAALGLKPGASENEIKSAYKKLALKHHPDRNIGNEESAKEKFVEIQAAYDALINPPDQKTRVDDKFTNKTDGVPSDRKSHHPRTKAKYTKYPEDIPQKKDGIPSDVRTKSQHPRTKANSTKYPEEKPDRSGPRDHATRKDDKNFFNPTSEFQEAWFQDLPELSARTRAKSTKHQEDKQRNRRAKSHATQKDDTAFFPSNNTPQFYQYQGFQYPVADVDDYEWTTPDFGKSGLDEKPYYLGRSPLHAPSQAQWHKDEPREYRHKDDVRIRKDEQRRCRDKDCTEPRKEENRDCRQKNHAHLRKEENRGHLDKENAERCDKYMKLPPSSYPIPRHLNPFGSSFDDGMNGIRISLGGMNISFDSGNSHGTGGETFPTPRDRSNGLTGRCRDCGNSAAVAPGEPRKDRAFCRCH